MRVLLDECVPRRFRSVLPGVQVSTAREQGWDSLRNGELLAAMRAAGFTTLVTVDRNLTFQQHIAASGIAVIVMYAVTNRLPDLVPLGPRVVEAIAVTPVGAIARVRASDGAILWLRRSLVPFAESRAANTPWTSAASTVPPAII